MEGVRELTRRAWQLPGTQDWRVLGRIRDLPDGAFTESDAALARAVSQAAAAARLRADPTAVQDVQVTIDALDRAAVMPFWRAALGYEQQGDDLVDRAGGTRPSGSRGRLRPARCATACTSTPCAQRAAVDALAAVRERGAASIAEHEYYATAADAEGNEEDIAVPVGREELWRAAQQP